MGFLFAAVDGKFRRCDAIARRFFNAKLGAEIEAAERTVNTAPVGSSINECANGHVATDA